MYKTSVKKIDAILDMIMPPQRGGITGYIIACVMIVFALAARLLIAPVEAGLPFLTFFPAATLTAVFGGMRAALFAVATCSALATYLFFPPYSAFSLTFQSNVIWSNVVFCLEEIIVILVVEAMYRQHRNYVATADLLEQITSAKQELQIASAAFHAQEGIMITDANNVIQRVNQGFTKITGYSAEEVVGQIPCLFRSGQHDEAFYASIQKSIENSGVWQGEIYQKRKNGKVYPSWLTISTIQADDRSVTHYVYTQTDMTARKAAEEEIERLAFFDPLTGLPNRRTLHDRLAQEIKKSQRSGLPLALLMLDLDNFKEVNDTLGHDQGDILLQETAKRLLNCVRETDTVARLGGDEFTIILSELAEVNIVERVAQTVLKALMQPYALREEQSHISASIGITLYPNDAAEPGELLRNADQAMYSAKSQGRNRYSYYTSSMQEAALNRMRLTDDLRDALELQQFEVYYQPIVELATGSIQKAEALIRWNHPDKKEIGPAQFIPLAESSGLIHEIGDWVFQKAAAQVQYWRKNIHPQFQISVNISPIQLHSPGDSYRQWINRLQALGLPGMSIVVEITEGILIEDHAVYHSMLRLFHNAGVQMAIDDFGTGYSALAYLKKFDIDYLKIDKSFINNLKPNSSDHAVCEAIIVMAHKLGLEVIAEGIETREQYDLLKAAGCDYGQGYFFSRPLETENFEAWIKTAEDGRFLMAGPHAMPEMPRRISR